MLNEVESSPMEQKKQDIYSPLWSAEEARSYIAIDHGLVRNQTHLKVWLHFIHIDTWIKLTSRIYTSLPIDIHSSLRIIGVKLSTMRRISCSGF